MKSKIGKVSATEKNPTTNDEFCFWLDDQVEVKPFDILKAENRVGDKTSTTFAIVKDLFHMTDSAGHISNYVSSDFGEIDSEPATNRLAVTYGVAQVIRNNQNIYMPLRDGVIVELANGDEIKEALGLHEIKKPIPAGFIEGTNNVSVPIHLNKDFLIGPEGAHLNISGISGLATKTSYAMFLLQAIQQQVSDTAIIILNVKGDDLLRIDQPNPNITDARKEAWKKVGLECKPFENVRYFYPYRNVEETFFANTSLDTKDLLSQVESGIASNFIYTYQQHKSCIDLLFSNIDDPQQTMESIFHHIEENSEFKDLTWPEFKDKIKEHYQPGGSRNKEIPIQSWKKFGRLITKSISNSIFQNSKSSTPANKHADKRHVFLSEELSQIHGGQVFVVDIAKLDEQLQCLVFGEILKAVNDLKYGETSRSEEEIPKHIIIFVDELNKYASSSSPKNSPILNYLLDITERGRSQGLVLFSAEQFKSPIHDRVKGNCSTNVYGRTNAIEISKPDYRYIPDVFKNMMTRLKAGELILSHAIFSTPLKIVFPYPAYKQRTDDNG